jgi:glycogen operon protein
VLVVRRRQLRNAMCLLMLSRGVPMFVAGDEFARTQQGNNNPYNQDNETSWIDWSRRDEFAEHERFVERLLAFRSHHDVLSDTAAWWGERVEWFGAGGPPDTSHGSRSIAFHLPGLYTMINMWWEPLRFEVQKPGGWRKIIDTALPAGFVGDDDPGPPGVGSTVHVGPRSVVVLVPA